jgi:hypothetical protein
VVDTLGNVCDRTRWFMTLSHDGEKHIIILEEKRHLCPLPTLSPPQSSELALGLGCDWLLRLSCVLCHPRVRFKPVKCHFYSHPREHCKFIG